MDRVWFRGRLAGHLKPAKREHQSLEYMALRCFACDAQFVSNI